MSLHGACETPLLEVDITHRITMDDCGGPTNPLTSGVHATIRIFKWEAEVDLYKPHDKLYFDRKYLMGNIPRLCRFELHGATRHPRNYSGDFTERMHNDPYYGQRPE